MRKAIAILLLAISVAGAGCTTPDTPQEDDVEANETTLTDNERGANPVNPSNGTDVNSTGAGSNGTDDNETDGDGVEGNETNENGTAGNETSGEEAESGETPGEDDEIVGTETAANDAQGDY